jgi:MFS family permease
MSLTATAEPVVQTYSKHDPYAALRVPSYLLFVAGRISFMVGWQMQMAAVGWQVYERLGSKLALAYVGLVSIIPMLCLVLPAGHLADRHDRRVNILCGQAIFFCASISLGVISLRQADPRLIYVCLFFLGVTRAITMPSIGALISSVIPREALGNAMTWSSTFLELTQIIGPAVAGLLIAASGGATVVYFTAAGCAVLCVIFFSLLRIRKRERPVQAATLHDLIGGVRFLFRTKLLLTAASLDLFAVFLGGATALLPVVAKDILHVGPAGFGWLRAAPSIGAITMAIVTAHRTPWRRAGRVLFLSFIGFGGAIIVFGLSRNFWLSIGMLILTGVFDNLNVVIRQTLLQLVTPDQMRGRVGSINMLFIGCSNELGGFESGLMAQWIGAVPAIVTGGIGTLLVVCTVMKISPALRRLGPLHEVKPAPL